MACYLPECRDGEPHAVSICQRRTAIAAAPPLVLGHPVALGRPPSLTPSSAATLRICLGQAPAAATMTLSAFNS